MKVQTFKEFDKSIEIVQGQDSALEFYGLSGTKVQNSNTVMFLKNKKFYSKLTFNPHIKDLALNIEKKFWDDLVAKNAPELQTLKNYFAVIFTSQDVNLSMSFLSKPFYDLKYGKRNNHVDGRQMGTATVHPTARIAQNVFLGESVIVEANAEILSGCVIMSGTVIGEGTKLYPNVTVYDDVKIGKHCRIHSGTVIGADGFGYNFSQGVHHKVWHTGSVIIQDHVEIGSNVSIDQGTMDPTVIGAGTKIDNQVQVGHNCELGRGVIICGQGGLAGSGSVGDYTVFGGRAGLGPDVHLGKAVQVAGGAMVSQDWPDGSIIAGHPARPLKEWMRGLAMVRKLSLEKDSKE